MSSMIYFLLKLFSVSIIIESKYNIGIDNLSNKFTKI